MIKAFKKWRKLVFSNKKASKLTKIRFWRSLHSGSRHDEPKLPATWRFAQHYRKRTLLWLPNEHGRFELYAESDLGHPFNDRGWFRGEWESPYNTLI